ncbi:hypothetical protein A5715_17855 [Mycolicibacter heraklionensis]|nr:hypothetical protein A5715_17855 [Mycolicibacter heraklionensis]
MTTVLGDFVKARSRFGRSANVERDHGGSAVDGYIPTGRALDVISRIARGLSDSTAGRTFSLTGPHGGGKSSLAVFLDGLLSAPTSVEFKTANRILKSIDDSVATELRAATRVVKASQTGFIRAYATARSEPVAATIGRALLSGAVRQFGRSQDFVPKDFGSSSHVPTSAEIRRCVIRMANAQPVVLVIDEFGKNLEHFASSPSDGDPFLLQELAEMTQGKDATPLVILTMQHLSFDEYIQDTSAARRREWSKVQGRFQDVPYIETSTESCRLVAAALEQDVVLRTAADAWVAHHTDTMEQLGFRDLVEDAAGAIPLHPLALGVLPELCSRYGQNERTLFSFVAGSEPSALPRYLTSASWKPGKSIPLVGLDVLYDYFLESWSNVIGASDGVSRWMEIETRIRDAAGLSADQLKVIKTIGLLNLVSNGGRFRASRPVLEFALDAQLSDGSIDEALTYLVDAGLVTYRAFSDEYRIWQGSDYNMRRAIENARHAYADAPLVELLGNAVNLESVVAGRHSQRTGILRVFGRQFSAGSADTRESVDPAWDGVIYYLTGTDPDAAAVMPLQDRRPAVYVVPRDVTSVREAAIGAAALRDALSSAEADQADWVARRELVERLSAAQQHLQTVIGRTWDARAEWLLAGSAKALNPHRGLSALLSDVADHTYPNTPRIANEMIARRELTSQGAKARRFLIDALLANPAAEAFGITGYGPDRAIYEAVFRKTGIHRNTDAGEWVLQAPKDRSWKAAWGLMNAAFDEAVESRVSLTQASARLTLPPVGLKEGIIPLLLIAGLAARRDQIALYEHGSLVLAIDDAVAERLAKNLSHFSIKNTQTRDRNRACVIESLVRRLGIQNRRSGVAPTFLNVATALYRELRLLPPFSQKTRRYLSPEAIAVRAAFHQAAEPDVLLFETLPKIFGIKPFGGQGQPDLEAAEAYAENLAKAVRELRDCYPRLLNWIADQLAQASSSTGQLPELRIALTADATRLDGHVLEPRLKAFVGALARQLDDQSWLENVAMVVSEGQAPRVWTDDTAGGFTLRIVQLGGALRRTSALLHERLAANLSAGYSSSRMTLTRPDGSESIELLSLTHQEKTLVDESFEPLLAALMKAARVSRSTACRMLMARLAAEHEPVVAGAVTEAIDEEGQRYG